MSGPRRGRRDDRNLIRSVVVKFEPDIYPNNVKCRVLAKADESPSVRHTEDDRPFIFREVRGDGGPDRLSRQAFVPVTGTRKLFEFSPRELGATFECQCHVGLLTLLAGIDAVCSAGEVMHRK